MRSEPVPIHSNLLQRCSPRSRSSRRFQAKLAAKTHCQEERARAAAHRARLIIVSKAPPRSIPSPFDHDGSQLELSLSVRFVTFGVVPKLLALRKWLHVSA